MDTYSTTEARILVVDDERPIVRLLTRALESVGYYHVTGMTDSVGVPDYLDSSPPDMIVLDLSMPGLDGFGLLGEINARLPKDTFLPVLVLSGLHDTESKERAFQAGAKDYLTKPVVLSEFLIHVDSLLQTRFTSLRLQQARDVMAHVIGRQADELCKSDTVRKHAEDELRESEFKFRTVADLTHDWEYWMGTDRRLIWMSPSCERVTGYTVDEFMADPGLVDAIVHPEDRGAVREHVSQAVNGDTASLDFRIVTKSGETRWIAHQCVGVHDREGRHLGRRASNRDISDRKMAEERLEESLARIRESQATIIQVLSSVTEFRDPYTAGHQQRVAEICVAIATRMGLAPDRIEGLEVAALLHDVGKVCVPLEILSTPGKLSPLQRLLVEGHVSAGHEILRPIFFSWPVAEIVLQHHERMNGSGYPAQLSGEQIELEARILGVADTFEAMTTHRPYRGALETSVALQEIEAGSGILFDVAVVDALVSLVADGTIAPRMELDLSACSFMS